jgi:hypothetical protein
MVRITHFIITKKIVANDLGSLSGNGKTIMNMPWFPRGLHKYIFILCILLLDLRFLWVLCISDFSGFPDPTYDIHLWSMTSCPHFWRHQPEKILKSIIPRRILAHSLSKDPFWIDFTNLGPMLWSQYSAISANFRRNNWRFSQKTNVLIKFLQKLIVVWEKRK